MKHTKENLTIFRALEKIKKKTKYPSNEYALYHELQTMLNELSLEDYSTAATAARKLVLIFRNIRYNGL